VTSHRALAHSALMSNTAYLMCGTSDDEPKLFATGGSQTFHPWGMAIRLFPARSADE
jgi:hypothetical protein